MSGESADLTCHGCGRSKLVDIPEFSVGSQTKHLYVHFAYSPLLLMMQATGSKVETSHHVPVQTFLTKGQAENKEYR